ncbi:MAG: hypothetical protein QW365_08900 [Candidatus Nezhaarchaeales archaeon]
MRELREGREVIRKPKILFIPLDVNLPYPNIVVTVFELRTIGKFPVKRLMLDVGIDELFLRQGYTQYPQWFLDLYVSVAKDLARKYEENFFPLIPDYPIRWRGSETGANFMRGIELIKQFKKHDFASWLPIVQWSGDSIASFLKSIEIYDPYLDGFERIAVSSGPILVDRSMAGPALMIARKRHPSAWIHALGLSLASKRTVDPLSFDSFDTSSMIPKRGNVEYAKLVDQKREFIFLKKIERLREVYGPLVE